MVHIDPAVGLVARPGQAGHSRPGATAAGGASTVGPGTPSGPPAVVPTGPLRPMELAGAAVLAGVTVVLAIVGWILPHASVLQTLGAVPMGLVAHRHRPRAVVAATVAAGVVAFLVAGTGPVYGVVVSAVVGGVVGDVKRRGRGVWTAAAAACVVAPLVALVSDALLAVFAATRKLTLDQIRNLVHGATGIVARIPPLRGAAHGIDSFTVAALRDWWLSVAVLVAVGVVATVVMAWVVLDAVLERLSWLPPEDRLEATGEDRSTAPLPVALRDVRFRYPGAESDALAGVDLRLDRPEMVALVGTNGSGKSTLARILAGRPATGGRVERTGAAGLGAVGGTALVAQRPESQILGVRVADDVVWGLAPGVTVDVEGLLDSVGLRGMGDRETTSLSGGEMQRLAVAAALARSPRLLLSDESTAMIDGAGRREVVDLLASLPRRHAMTVVHVTHRAEETRSADRIVHLERGQVVDADTVAFLGAGAAALPPAPQWVPPTPTTPAPTPGARPGGRPVTPTPVLEVRNVGHVYAYGTPWAHTALRGVDLRIGDGEGVLVVGDNGSGKSTLAWVLAGLLAPTSGGCLLDGAPVREQLGGVALAFQHARLQLQRPTVGEDITAAAGTDTDGARAALESVGLDADMLNRPIDQLSGGQMRRVALAGLLARKPRVLVLDEPLAGLDPPSRRGVLALLARLRAERGLTLVVISHDLDGMDGICGRTVRLVGGSIAADADGANRQ